MENAVGVDAFVSQLSTGLSANNIWGAIVPFAALILIVTLVAVGRRIANKNLKAAKNGSNGKI